MSKITIYDPVCQDGHDKSGFRVNGARDRDRDTAIAKAKKHSAFRHPDTKIIYIDSWEISEYENERHP